MSESAKSCAVEEIKRGEGLKKRLYQHIYTHANEHTDLARRVLQSLSTALHLLVQPETKQRSSSETQSTDICSSSLKRKKQTKGEAPNKIRTYYRCTYKDKGCPATKKIQQQDDDMCNYKSPMFQVIYDGKHTCTSSISSTDEFVVFHHDQPTFTLSEVKKSSPFQCVTTNEIFGGKPEDDHDSRRSDIDQKLFTELSSAQKIENDVVSCDSVVEMIDFPYHQFEPECCPVLESLLSSFT